MKFRMLPFRLDFPTLRLLLVCLIISGAAGVSLPTAEARPKQKEMNRPYADMKRWHLGFSIGTCLQDLNFTHNGFVTPDGQQWFTEIPSWNPGINVQVLADLRLHQYFNLRFTPGMSFSFKDAVMRDHVTGATHTQNIKSVYVITPLDLKISGDRLHNARPYVTVGAMGAFDVGKKKSDFLMFNTADAYLTVGLGCDFYLPFFKFNPEIKFCFGLTDILRHKRPDLDDDPETFKITQSLKKVKSNMFMLTFYFE
ncbi:MAG: PorT family protein [Muribaculaceae bacterium]|nr:PorT family protein [Muribaculaceae bacterium]